MEMKTNKEAISKEEILSMPIDQVRRELAQKGINTDKLYASVIKKVQQAKKKKN